MHPILNFQINLNIEKVKYLSGVWYKKRLKLFLGKSDIRKEVFHI